MSQRVGANAPPDDRLRDIRVFAGSRISRCSCGLLAAGAQYLRVYLRQLRQKIEQDHERPQFVLTETGIGYRLRAGD